MRRGWLLEPRTLRTPILEIVHPFSLIALCNGLFLRFFDPIVEPGCDSFSELHWGGPNEPSNVGVLSTFRHRVSGPSLELASFQWRPKPGHSASRGLAVHDGRQSFRFGLIWAKIFSAQITFAKKHLALQVDTPSAKRFRNVFGYVSPIKPEEFEGSITPLCAQVVIKRPFNYGTLSWGKAFIPRTAG